MQLHKHASSAPGRYVYTLEHINSDFSGSKCGRCRACFNRGTFKQSCKNMGTHYDRGEFVYEFDAYPDERFEGERLFFSLCARLFLVLSQQCYLSISGDVSEDAVSNPPSSKQATHMDIASKKQAEPFGSKQAVRVSAASKKQAEPSSSKQAVRVGSASKKQAEPSSSKKVDTITADRDHLKADRDTQRQTEATLMERLRMAEAMAHTNEQAITAVVKELRGSLGAMQQAVQNAVKESTEHLLSSFSTLIDEKLGAMQSVTSQLEPVTEEPVTKAQPAQEVLPELSKKVRL